MRRPLRLEPDDGLVARIHDGDDDAVAELQRRHGAYLRRTCARVVGPDGADDALQETLVKATAALRREEVAGMRLRPWLQRIAHNAAVDQLRRRPAGSDELDAEDAHSPSAGQVAEERERLRTVLAVVDGLPERQRRALLLRELEGRDYAEIAEALDASEGMVRQLLFRARTTLRTAAAAITAPLWLLRGHAEVAGGLGTSAAAKVATGVAVTAVVATGGAVALHPDRQVAGAHNVSPPALVAAARSPAVAPVAQRQVAPPRHRAPHRRHRAPARRVAAARATVVAAAAPVRRDHHAHRTRPAPAAAATPPAQTTPAARPQPAAPAQITPAPAPQTTPAQTTPTMTTPAAPTPVGQVASYQQGSGYGGFLTIDRDGAPDTAFLGEHTDLRCITVHDGQASEAVTCGREQLTAGTAVVEATHASNGRGSELWTTVILELAG